MTVKYRSNLLMALLALTFISLSYCSDDSDFFIGGNFLETFQDANGNIKHAASLVGYNMETQTLDDDFEGVYLEYGNLEVLTTTPSGIYAAGAFKFVDYDYSNTITEYDPDDDEWTSLNDGIFCDNCVKYIAGVDNTVFFAGDGVKLHTLESLPGVNVDGIVMMDAETEEFAALLDPTDVFPTNPTIAGLAASSDSLFIYETSSAAIYQYNLNEGAFTLLFSNFTLTPFEGSLVVASTGDIYLSVYSLQGTLFTELIYYWPKSFTPGMAPTTISITEGSLSEYTCTKLITTAYMEGLLVAIPDSTSGCKVYFQYIEAGAVTTHQIPPTTNPVAALAVGQNGEVWSSQQIPDYSNPNTNFNHLYYWNASISYWAIVSLSSEDIDDYTIQLMTYSSEKSSVYLYLIDYDANGSPYELVRVKSDSLEVSKKSPGSLTLPGFVVGLAYDSDHDALYVAGTFSSVGKGPSNNLAYYSFKEKEWTGLSTGAIAGITSIESTLYLIYSQCPNANEAIPFNAYSISDDDVADEVKDNLPILYADHGCFHTIASNSTHVYIAGTFVAQISLDLAFGVLIYDVEEDKWSTLPIPQEITTTEGTWDISAITEFEYNNTPLLAFAGEFIFSTTDNAGNPITYVNVALFDLAANNWLPISPPDLLEINSVVYMYDGLLLLAGTAVPGASTASVVSYNISSGVNSTMPGLHSVVTSLLLYTEMDKDDNPLWTTVYAAGHSATGVSASNYTSPPAWGPIGNVYNNLYDGYAIAMLYSTGGVGSGGENGGSSGGSSDWWWITLIVVGSLIAIVSVLVVLAAAGYFVYHRQRAQYSSL